jgi:hypothetical protein
MNRYIRHTELDGIFTLAVQDDKYPVQEIWLFLEDWFGRKAEKDDIKRYIKQLESYECEFGEDGFLENTEEMKERVRLLKPLKQVIDIMNEKYADVVLID